MVKTCYPEPSKPCRDLEHHFDRTADKKTGITMGDYWDCGCNGKLLGSERKGYNPRVNPRPVWCPLTQSEEQKPTI